MSKLFMLIGKPDFLIYVLSFKLQPQLTVLNVQSGVSFLKPALCNFLSLCFLYLYSDSKLQNRLDFDWEKCLSINSLSHFLYIRLIKKYMGVFENSVPAL